MWISRTSFVCLLCFLGFIVSASTSHAVTVYFLDSGGTTTIGGKTYAKAWGYNCDEVKKRFADSTPATSVSGSCSSLTYNWNGWKYNRNLGYRSVSCGQPSRPYKNSTGWKCGPVSDLPGECECVVQSGCDSLYQQTEHAVCYDAITSEQSNDHFISSFDDSGSGCPTYDSECGPLTDSCSHPNYANHPTCTDYCDLPENFGDRSCQERECYLNPTHPTCGPPTPDECAASSANGDPFLGCKDWCESNARYATYPQCSAGGIPSTEGITCATEAECFEQMQVSVADECAGSTNQTWNFDYQTYEHSLECHFDNGGSAGGNSSGEFLDNTSDNVNTPDRTADNTPDNTPEADALDAADNQVAALNNANKNLNAIESQSELTNENLSTMSGQLEEIRAAIAANGNGDSGSGTGDLSGVEQRLDTIKDYQQADPTATIETINTSHPASDITNEIDLSQIQFNADGFLGGGSCPSPVTFNVMGSSFSYSYSFVCGMAPSIKPWVIGLSYIFAMFLFVRIVGS